MKKSYGKGDKSNDERLQNQTLQLDNEDLGIGSGSVITNRELVTRELEARTVEWDTINRAGLVIREDFREIN